MKPKKDKSTEIASAPGPISQAGVLNNLTGSWRYLRPRYEQKLAPCIAACPAGERVEMWIRLFQEEEYDEACRLIKTVNPFPRVCGRVCFHPCESECNRGQYDRPIAIHALERFIGDNAKNSFTASKTAPTGKRIGIVGSGPAGLTCAYHLARLGHSVSVYEAEAEPGGLLRYGIPSYRLPKDVLADEISDIARTGVQIKAGSRIADIEEFRRKHDAVFVAAGLSAPQEMGISGEETEGVIDGLTFLKQINSGRTPSLGRKVVVIGGGNAAIDAARTAIRLGCESTILYRRTKDEMPAYVPEVEEAQREGVTIQYLVQPTEFARDSNGAMLVACVRTRLGSPDDSGRKKAEPIPNSQFIIQTDTVVTATGERPDKRLAEQLIMHHGSRATSLPAGVFAGGDFLSMDRTVAHAIGAGRRASVLIHAYLVGITQDPAAYPEQELVSFDRLNLDYFPHRPRIRLPMLSLREREKNFEEIYRSISGQSATVEAARCFHCGACISCDNCRTYCPDIAVKKTADGNYAIDYDYCKGCGICVFECPRNAMSITEEERS